MATLHDKDLGAFWAEHFPNRKESQASRMLLETLIGVMLQREEFRTEQHFAETLHKVLATIRIPRHEFYEFQREIEAETK